MVRRVFHRISLIREWQTGVILEEVDVIQAVFVSRGIAKGMWNVEDYFLSSTALNIPVSDPHRFTVYTEDTESIPGWLNRGRAYLTKIGTPPSLSAIFRTT